MRKYVFILVFVLLFTPVKGMSITSLEELVQEKNPLQGTRILDDDQAGFTITFTVYKPEFGSVEGDISWPDQGARTRFKGMFMDGALVLKEVSVLEGNDVRIGTLYRLQGIQGSEVVGTVGKDEGAVQIHLPGSPAQEKTIASSAAQAVEENAQDDAAVIVREESAAAVIESEIQAKYPQDGGSPDQLAAENTEQPANTSAEDRRAGDSLSDSQDPVTPDEPVGNISPDKAKLFTPSPDMNQVLWSHLRTVDDRKQEELFVNGRQLDLPPLKAVEEVVHIKDGGYVAKVALYNEGSPYFPDYALLINGILSERFDGAYGQDNFTATDDRAHWAAGFTNKNDQGGVTSTIFLDGEKKMELPGKVVLIGLNQDGTKPAVVTTVEHQDGQEQQQLYLDGTPMGVIVAGVETMAFDPQTGDLYWDAITLPYQNTSKSLLFKNDTVISKEMREVDPVLPLSHYSIFTDQHGLAWIEERESGDYLGTEAGEYGPFGEIGTISFSAEGKCAFWAEQNGKIELFIDGRPTGITGFSSEENIVWSPDSLHWSTVAAGEPNTFVIVEDGKTISDGYANVSLLGYSPDSSRLIAVVEQPEQGYKIWEKGNEGSAWMKKWVNGMPVIFSPDSQHLYYFSVHPQMNTPVLNRDFQAVEREGVVFPALKFTSANTVQFFEKTGGEQGTIWLREMPQ